MFRRSLIAWAALVLAGVACGGDDGGGEGVASVSGGSSGAVDDAAAAAATEEELLAYVECLRGEGLEVPDPTVDEDGNLVMERPELPSSGDTQEALDAFREAREACGDPPEGAFGGGREESSAEFQDAMLEFAQCMRNQGVDVPDPDFSADDEDAGAGAGGGPFGEALDRSDPTVAAAIEECQEIIADVLPGDAAGGGE